MNFLKKIFSWRNKNMIKLVIKERGFTIDFEGTTVRTPAEITIHQNKLNLLLTYLKSQGIKNYNIISGDDINVEKPEPQFKKPDPAPIQPQVINNTDPELMNKMLDKFDSLEQILKVIAEKEPVVVQTATEQVLTTKTKKKKDIEDEPATFIPSSNTDAMKVQGGNKKTRTREDSATDAADALSNLQKGK